MNHHSQTLAGSQILRLPAVMSKIGMKRSWIYREIAAGRFPAPIKIGRASGWDAAVIDAWTQDRLAGRAFGQTAG